MPLYQLLSQPKFSMSFLYKVHAQPIQFLKNANTSNDFICEIQERNLYLALISVTMTTNGLFKAISILAHSFNNTDKNGMDVEEKTKLLQCHIIHSNDSESHTELRKVQRV